MNLSIRRKVEYHSHSEKRERSALHLTVKNSKSDVRNLPSRCVGVAVLFTIWERNKKMGEKEIQKINEWIEKMNNTYEPLIPKFDVSKDYNTMKTLHENMMWVDNPYEVAVLVLDKNDKKVRQV